MLLKISAHVIPNLPEKAGRGKQGWFVYAKNAQQASGDVPAPRFEMGASICEQLSGVGPFCFSIKMHPLCPISNFKGMVLKHMLSRCVLCPYRSLRLTYIHAGEVAVEMLQAAGAEGTEA